MLTPKAKVYLSIYLGIAILLVIYVISSVKQASEDSRIRKEGVHRKAESSVSKKYEPKPVSKPKPKPVATPKPVSKKKVYPKFKVLDWENTLRSQGIKMGDKLKVQGYLSWGF